jgi:hypothetical protein
MGMITLFLDMNHNDVCFNNTVGHLHHDGAFFISACWYLDGDFVEFQPLLSLAGPRGSAHDILQAFLKGREERKSRHNMRRIGRKRDEHEQ